MFLEAYIVYGIIANFIAMIVGVIVITVKIVLVAKTNPVELQKLRMWMDDTTINKENAPAWKRVADSLTIFIPFYQVYFTFWFVWFMGGSTHTAEGTAWAMLESRKKHIIQFER